MTHLHCSVRSAFAGRKKRVSATTSLASRVSRTAPKGFQPSPIVAMEVTLSQMPSVDEKTDMESSVVPTTSEEDAAQGGYILVDPEG